MLSIILAAAANLYPYYDPQYHTLAFSTKGGMCRIKGKEAYNTYNLGDHKCYKLGGLMLATSTINMVTIDESGDSKPERIYTYSPDRGWIQYR